MDLKQFDLITLHFFHRFPHVQGHDLPPSEAFSLFQCTAEVEGNQDCQQRRNEDIKPSGLLVEERKEKLHYPQDAVGKGDVFEQGRCKSAD